MFPVLRQHCESLTLEPLQSGDGDEEAHIVLHRERLNFQAALFGRLCLMWPLGPRNSRIPYQGISCVVFQLPATPTPCVLPCRAQGERSVAHTEARLHEREVCCGALGSFPSLLGPAEPHGATRHKEAEARVSTQSASSSSISSHLTTTGSFICTPGTPRPRRPPSSKAQVTSAKAAAGAG